MTYLLTNLLERIKWKQFFKHFFLMLSELCLHSQHSLLSSVLGQPTLDISRILIDWLFCIDRNHCFNIIDLHLFSNSVYPFSYNSDATSITSDG